MTLKIIPILVIAAVIVGCKSADSTATNTTPDNTAATTGATADNAPKTGDSATSSATDTPATDSGTGIAAFVGKWADDDPTHKGTITEVKDDGTMSMSGPDPDPALPKGTTIEADATLKVDGDKATLHLVSAKMVASDSASDKDKAVIDEANKKLADPKFAASQKDLVGTVKWNGKDSFTVTDSVTKKATTYTRQS